MVVGSNNKNVLLSSSFLEKLTIFSRTPVIYTYIYIYIYIYIYMCVCVCVCVCVLSMYQYQTKSPTSLSLSLSLSIYIYIYNHHHHVVLVARISLTLSRHFPYRSSPQAGLPDNIPYPHIVAECMFVLAVLLLPGNVCGSTRVHHFLVRPCFSSSVLHVWFV